MSTSGNTSWALTRDSIVNSAYRKLGYLAQGQTLDAEPLANGVEALNAVVSLLVTDGMPLWKRTTQTFALNGTSQVYTIPASIKLAQVVLVDTTGGTQYDIIEKSLYDFNRLPNNSGPGIPVHYTYQPTLTDGTLSLWPQASDAGTIAQKQLQVVFQKDFDGFFSASDSLDFPAYWTQAIIYALAVTLAPETGLPLNDRGTLKKEADEYKKLASDYGDEDGSLYLSPDYIGRGRS